MALLEIKDLDVFYGKAQALKKVSLFLEKGECIGVVGPVTAGKTTLLDSILHLTRWRGQITFDGVDLSKLTTMDIVKRLKISCAAERNKIFPYMNVRDNLLVGAYCERGSINENLKKVFELFPVLKERLNQMAGTLSGGQQQMLAFGKSLMLTPKMLLLDEPTLGLDVAVVRKISEVIRELRKMDVSILIAEQNLVFTAEHASRLYALKAGEVALETTPEGLKSDEEVRKIYFGL